MLYGLMEIKNCLVSLLCQLIQLSTQVLPTGFFAFIERIFQCPLQMPGCTVVKFFFVK